MESLHNCGKLSMVARLCSKCLKNLNLGRDRVWTEGVQNSFFHFQSIYFVILFEKTWLCFLLNLNAKGDFCNKKLVCQMHSLTTNSKYTWPYIRNLRQRRNLIDTYVKIWTWLVIGCKLGRCSKFIFHFQSILLRYLIWKKHDYVFC